MEIVVVAALITIFTAIVVTRYRSFEGTTVLKNLAFEVGLSVREAQLLTISSKPVAGVEQDSYGIIFYKATNSYIIFQDDRPTGITALGNDVYNNGIDPVVRQYSLANGAKIEAICLTVAGTESCTYNTGTATFDRPHLDTALRADSSTGTELKIKIRDKNSLSAAPREIIISKSARIEVK